MKHCKIIALLLAILMVAALFGGCAKDQKPNESQQPVNNEPVENEPQKGDGTQGEEPPAEETGKALKIAVVFNDSGLGDGSFNDNTYVGLQRAKDELGITFDYSEPKSQSDYESLLMSYAQTEEYDLILGIGFSIGSSMEKVAEIFPEQKFMLLDTSVALDNVASFEYRSEEAAYMAGVVAGLATLDTSIPNINDKNIIGFVGAMDIPLIQVFKDGFEEGAKSVNPDVKVLSAYVGDWSDPATAKELAVSQYQQGADIIYQVASLGGLGVIEGASSNNFYCIGQDDNQNGLAPDNVILSVLKRLDNTVYSVIKDLQDGVFHGGSNIWGLKEDAVDITYEGSNVAIPDSIKEAAETARQDILNK